VQPSKPGVDQKVVDELNHKIRELSKKTKDLEKDLWEKDKEIDNYRNVA